MSLHGMTCRSVIKKHSYRLLSVDIIGAFSRISEGLKHAVVVKCGSKEEFGSYDAFMEKLKGMEIKWNGERSLAFTDSQYGAFQVTDAGDFLLNGETILPEPVKGFKFTRTKLQQIITE